MPPSDSTPSGPEPLRRARGKRKPKDEMRGRLKPHDPFELIRWLALSQPDPRKALSELVQNSLDAGSRRIRVTRVREKGAPCLSIFDDGEGVIPELSRTEALRYIATHIGHSRKKALSPQERLTLMTQGQYGIGLLGFWSLGERLEMRTVLPGQAPYRLILHRDSSKFLIEPLRGRLPLEERWTEVVVIGLHPEAMGVLVGRRAADYLALELRGQLLAREVDLVVEDRMSRGRSQKILPVRPPRFLGERLEGFGPLDVHGYPPIRMEIYLSGEPDDDDAPRGLAVYCSGTLVAEGFHELAALEMDHAPWTDPRLTGLVDFPGFQVAPGSRRGLVPDDAAGAFARALLGVEPVLSGVLESLDRRRAEELDRTLIRDLQRAFRDFYRQRPRYQMLPVQSKKDEGAGPGTSAAPGGEADGTAPAQAPPGRAADLEGPDAGAPRTPPLDLLPPGPLASVGVTPSSLRVECLASRGVLATGLDAVGRPVEGEVSYSWRVIGSVGSIAEIPEGQGRALFTATAQPSEGSLAVTARQGQREAHTEIPVEVLEEIPSRRPDEGIPEPELVDGPSAGWRSRMMDGRWQVNIGHREYRSIAERPAVKLRYLAILFAKEIVLRSSQDPRLEKPLEQLVEVAAYADRNLSGRRGRKGGTGSA